ncbi:MAG: hypothetical protein ACYDIE_08690 [Candidatus Krumholzibacteriia bacterium]
MSSRPPQETEGVAGRRVIYAVMLLAVIAPMVWRISFRERPSAMTRDIFAAIEALPPGARVVLAYDFDPASEPETKPMGDAFTRHLALKQARIFYLTLWPLGQGEIDMVTRRVLATEFPEYRYGTDYVNLGFMSGNEGVISVAMTDLKKGFSTDVHNASTGVDGGLPIMRGVENLRNMDLIVDVAAGYPGLREWIQYAAVPGRIPIIGGSVAVKSPELFPYVPSQCLGILAGLKGAAEYEQLLIDRYPHLDRPDVRVALERMGPQTVAHLVVMLLIIIGNVIHLAHRRREGRAA